MLLLATTSSKLQVVTGSAVANTVMHASWVFFCFVICLKLFIQSK